MSTSATSATSALGYAVVVPPRLARPVPTTTVYVRRRLLVVGVLVAMVLVLLFGPGNVLANRGGAPASTPTVRPAPTYLVQPGDTLWSIAEAHHGSDSLAAYVDALVAANGGTQLQVGQVVALP